MATQLLLLLHALPGWVFCSPQATAGLAEMSSPEGRAENLGCWQLELARRRGHQ